MTHFIRKVEHTCTIAKLLDWNNQWQAKMQDVEFLCTPDRLKRYKQFMNDNGERIKTHIEAMNKIVEEHFEMENGNVKMVDKKQVLKEGKTMEDFDANRTEYLLQEVPYYL